MIIEISSTRIIQIWMDNKYGLNIKLVEDIPNGEFKTLDHAFITVDIDNQIKIER
jgi:hypothetical protein